MSCSRTQTGAGGVLNLSPPDPDYDAIPLGNCTLRFKTPSSG